MCTTPPSLRICCSGEWLQWGARRTRATSPVRRPACAPARPCPQRQPSLPPSACLPAFLALNRSSIVNPSSRVWERNAGYTNSDDVAASPLKSLAKLAYYHAMALLYGCVGAFAQVKEGRDAALPLVACLRRPPEAALALAVPARSTLCPAFRSLAPHPPATVPPPAKPPGGDGEQQLDAAAHRGAVVAVAPPAARLPALRHARAAGAAPRPPPEAHLHRVGGAVPAGEGPRAAAASAGGGEGRRHPPLAALRAPLPARLAATCA